MNYVDVQWQSADGLQLVGRSWEPDSEPRAVVCLVHGLGEHCGRYQHVAAALTEAGFAVLACDQRGHGRSAGKRGVIPSYDALMDDIGLLLEQASQRYPGKPRFLYGHSLGGNEVINYALRRKPDAGRCGGHQPRPAHGLQAAGRAACSRPADEQAVAGLHHAQRPGAGRDLARSGRGRGLPAGSPGA